DPLGATPAAEPHIPLKAIAHNAPHATLHLLRNPAALRRFLADVARNHLDARSSPASRSPFSCKANTFTRAGTPRPPVRPLPWHLRATGPRAVGAPPHARGPLPCASRRTRSCRDRAASSAPAASMRSQGGRRREDERRSPASRPLGAEPPSAATHAVPAQFRRPRSSLRP